MEDAQPAPPYESPAVRAWIAIVVLVAIIVADLVAIGSDIAEVRLLERAGSEGISFQEADANDVRQAAIGAVQLVLFIGAAVAFIAWLRRMYENAIALAPPDPRYGAGWTIGAWFVPVWNLFRPVQLVNDVRRSGEPHPNWVPLVIWSWWGLWLASLVLHNVSLSESGDNETLDSAIAGSKWLAAADGLDALAAGLAIAVVYVLTHAQEERAERRV
jgi:hypothetical protein